ncbi:MAG: hypothetical protein ACTSYD_02425 [Candidatus Heimdallarchaeaceae archaeon]
MKSIKVREYVKSKTNRNSNIIKKKLKSKGLSYNYFIKTVEEFLKELKKKNPSEFVIERKYKRISYFMRNIMGEDHYIFKK